MSDANDKTVQSYNTHVQDYIDHVPHEVTGIIKEWIDTAIEGLPKDASILEFGSAFGRDAAYLQNRGYTVECSDAAESFVSLLRQKGLKARLSTSPNPKQLVSSH
jgi:2-polyprenyl-3-methyl-5-hydroxy-6-metoxy-1,4-benzoquinol methylase